MVIPGLRVSIQRRTVSSVGGKEGLRPVGKTSSSWTPERADGSEAFRARMMLIAPPTVSGIWL